MPYGRRATPKPCDACGAQTTRRRWCDGCAPLKQRAAQDAWHAANMDKAREVQRRFRERNRHRLTKRATMFGVLEEEFAKMIAAQNGRCAICGTAEPGDRGWNLDHDHRYAPKDPTGHRGALCRNCNLLLGYARDREEVLSGAIAYLRRHRLRQVG